MPPSHPQSLRLGFQIGRGGPPPPKNAEPRFSALPGLMPSKRGRGRRGTIIAGKVLAGFDLLTLGNTAVKGETLTDTVDSKAFLISADLVWSLKGTAGEGPIEVGVAHSDYSDTEIEEWIEANGSWNQGDKIQQERAKRKCRRVGIFALQDASEVLNDGKPIRTKCGWMLEEDQTLKVWAYNRSGATLTTGTVVKCDGTCYLRPA